MEYNRRPALCEAESDSRSGYPCVGTAYAATGLCLHHLHEAEAEATADAADDELSPTMARLIALAADPDDQDGCG